MTFTTIGLTRDGAVAEVRLARAALRNPVDAQLLGELERAAESLAGDDGVSAVLLTADGEAFSCGGESTPTAGDAFRRLELLPQPVIACIEGEAAGAGLELALACDLRIAGEAATFALPQVSEGGVPGAGGTQRLPRLAGRGKALEMILLGVPLDAPAALACGLVNAVAPRGGARDAGLRLARSIAERGPLAVRYAKEAVLRGLDLPLEQALRYETDLTVILQTTADRAEGVRAFLEKRPPRFEGR